MTTSIDRDNVSFKWNGGRAKWIVRSSIADGMERAAERMVRLVRKYISIDYPPASNPGGFPRRRTGNLQKSIAWWINRKTLEVKVGPTVDAEYGWFLEYGTSKMAPRPFLTPALLAAATFIANTIARNAAIAMNKYGRSA